MTLDAPGAETVNQADTPLKQRFPEIIAGDADRAFAAAPVKIDARFTTAPQHQNPMELIATVAEWKEGKLISAREALRTQKRSAMAWPRRWV